MIIPIKPSNPSISESYSVSIMAIKPYQIWVHAVWLSYVACPNRCGEKILDAYYPLTGV